jgi:anti-sigma factor RsiW
MNDPKDLIQGYIDGELTPIQEAELNAWIKQDPAVPAIVGAAVMLHDQLANKMRASRDLVSAPVRFPSFPSHSGKRIVRALPFSSRWRRLLFCLS